MAYEIHDLIGLFNMKKYISRFHYLTHDLPHRTHIEQVRIACKAGANWIQYRCLSKKDDELLNDIHNIAALCDDWGATLIVTNHVHLIGQADVQGIHIEDMQADLKQVRNLIGEDKTLGASTNSFEDIQRIYQAGVADYIGCGPFGHTDTKPNDYPHLGYQGYRDIRDKMDENDIEIPILAVGGVTQNDVEQLITCGAFGVAVSGAINNADDPAEAYKGFHRKLF